MKVKSMPVGLAVAAVIVVAIALIGGSLRNSPGGVPSPSPQSSRSTAVQPSAPESAGQIVVKDAQAWPRSGIGNPVVVTATLINNSGRDDALIGGSSPIAPSSGLYGPCACLTPEPTDPTTGLPGLFPEAGLSIKAGATIDTAGRTVIVLYGLTSPAVPGQSIDVTFRFQSAPSVTVSVPVMSATR
jgi:copper(I)-binding protein